MLSLGKFKKKLQFVWHKRRKKSKILHPWSCTVIISSENEKKEETHPFFRKDLQPVTGYNNIRFILHASTIQTKNRFLIHLFLYFPMPSHH